MYRGDKIHKQPDARWHRVAGQEGGEQLDAIPSEISEALDEMASLQILRHVPERLQR